jgi:protein-S-isoprenylcysteine O-methyltransferase Ste14
MNSLRRKLLTLITGLIIFLGLPLLSWGLGDLSAFILSPGRITYAAAIVMLQIFGAAYHSHPGGSRHERKPGVARHQVDLILIQVLSLCVVVVAPSSDKHAIGIIPADESVRLLGTLLVIAGFMLMQIAEKYLGKQFSVEVTLQQDHGLVQHGPYKLIRHPRYLGILTLFLGISIVFRSYLSAAFVLALGIVLLWRVFAEEALMHQEFGEEWNAYCKRSWRIVPFVF